MRKSSPDSRASFMVSKKDSKTAVASVLFNLALFEIWPTIPALVHVVAWLLFRLTDFLNKCNFYESYHF